MPMAGDLSNLGKLHGFGLEELLESPFAELSAVARLLEAAEGRVDVKGPVVDLDLARTNPAGDPDRVLLVTGEDPGIQTEDRVVGQSNSLVLVVVGLDDQDGAENLLTHDRHVRRDVGEDRRSYEETPLQPVRRG